jgi:SAM-dependent methyltransferase
MTYRYDRRFYETNVRLNAPSAGRIIAALLTVQPIDSVLDVGCARGAWLREWARAGIKDFHGMDGLYAGESHLMIDQDHFTRADLASGFDLRRQFDLVQSLEVAEHLPGHASAAFIEALVRHSRGLVLFSAAPPGQGGENHVNEQSYDFWRDHFRAHGYHAVDWIRPQFVGDQEIAYWYRYNIMLYVSEPMLERLPEPVRRHKVPDDEPIADISLLLFRVRKRIVLVMPHPVIKGLSRIKTQFYSR